MSIGFNLSLSDLMLVDNFAEAFGKNDKQAIYKILEQNGFDVSMGVEEVVCQHRNLQGKVVNCLMYQGHELSSPEWLCSGNATWLNVVEHSSLDLRIDLKNMSKMWSTGDSLDYAQKHGIQSDN